MSWREVNYEKEGKIRVAFVGDSFTFGCWSDDIEKSFVGVFDSLLASKNYESLNFGVGGYGLDDEELILKEKVFQFDPDYVVLMFFNGNDFRDTYLGLNKYTINDGTAQLNEEKIPLEYRTTEYRTTEYRTATGKERLKIFLRNHLAMYRALSNLKRSMITNSNAKKDVSILLNDFKIDKHDFTSYSFWSQSDYPPIAVQAKDVSLRTLDRIRSYLQERHVNLLIVTIPYRDQVYVKNVSGSEYDVEYPQKYVEMYAKLYDVPYLDLLPVLRDYVRETKEELYVRGDPHFNNKGHSISGQIIADWFLSSVHTHMLRRSTISH